MIKIAANILFECNLLHHYFLNKGATNIVSMSSDDQLKQLSNYDWRAFFEVLPTKDCLQQLKGHRMQLVYTPTGFLATIKTEAESKTPLIGLTANTKFSFILRRKTEQFEHFTDISLEKIFGQIYYFNNLNKPQATRLTLSKGASLGNPSLTYSNENDLIRKIRSLYLHEIRTQVTNTTITLQSVTADMTAPKIFEQEINLDAGGTHVALDLRRIPTGLYLLVEQNGATTEEEILYLDNGSLPSDAFGVIEIFGSSNSHENYHLLTNTGEIKESPPIYEIRWNNRKTTWRYHFKSDQTEVQGASINVEFEDATNKKVLVTKQVQPLSSSGGIIIKKGTGENDTLPNPSTKLIVPDEDAGKVYSDVYM